MKPTEKEKQMDYKPLIEEAKKRNNMTEYALNKALGYRSVSMIYRLKRGQAGMSADKLMDLMKLAGKVGGLILSVSVMWSFSPDANAATTGGVGISLAALSLYIM